MSDKIRKMYLFYKNAHKKKMIRTMMAVKKLYGIKGLRIAIGNKINGRPLLMGIESYHAHEEGSHSSINYYNTIGEEIFLKQQSEYAKEEILNKIENMSYRPLISIIMPMYNAPIRWLTKAIESIQNQYYTNWELCLVDDGSKDGRGYAVVREMAKEDDRIKLFKMPQNGGISAASNKALEMCRGEYTALIDQDDEITFDALFWVAEEVNKNNNLDFIYTDECKIGCGHTYDRFDFFFKPDWSPSMLVNYMYSSHLTIYRTDIIRKVGGFRTQYDFSQDYDLALRVSRITSEISHIERVLYYWRTLPTSGAAGGKDFARITNLDALQSWYEKQGLDVVMEKHERSNYGRLIMKDNLKVSIIIPTDSYDNLKQCIQGILCNTSYSNIELIPVTNSQLAEAIAEEYAYVKQLKMCHYNEVYNFSKKCNKGAEIATGEILVFYNDDVVPFSRDWLERQMEILEYSGVGGVSPLLLHEDQTIQYAGMITGTPGIVGTSFNGRHFLNPVQNPYNHLLLRDVSVLCGACTTMKKNVFQEIGGFDDVNTPNGHSDLDLSFKLLKRGYRCVYTPYSVLTHIGNHSWAAKNKADKADIFCIKKWGKYLERDMYFTDSMKKMFYPDFGYKYKIYSPCNIVIPENKSGKDILFVTHELTRTGAPVVLKEMVEVILRNGDFPVVLSPIDGPLRKEYLEMGVTVIIDESFVHEHWMFEHFARNFDLVIANTLACSNVIKLLEDSLPPVIWWIHEGEIAFEHFKQIIPKRIGKNINVYCGGQYALNVFKRYIKGHKADILNYGIDDFGNSIMKTGQYDKVKILLAGTYEKRKGQDILVEAIKKLPMKLKSEIEFVFMGNVLEEEIYNKVRDLADKEESVNIIAPMDRSKLFDFYETVTCVVSPSRDDPMPVVMTEAMMKSKVCICSDKTGTSYYVKDSENGFVFENENVDQLVEKIVFIVQNKDKLEQIRLNSRKTYEENFEKNIFKKNVESIIGGLIS